MWIRIRMCNPANYVTLSNSTVNYINCDINHREIMLSEMAALIFISMILTVLSAAAAEDFAASLRGELLKHRVFVNLHKDCGSPLRPAEAVRVARADEAQAPSRPPRCSGRSRAGSTDPPGEGRIKAALGAVQDVVSDLAPQGLPEHVLPPAASDL